MHAPPASTAHFPLSLARALIWSALLVVLVWLGLAIRVGHGEPPKAVSFVFRDMDNREVRLADYRGKWVLVSFWAPWCPLCKVQIPTLNQLNARPDFRVIGIALDYGDNAASVREAIALGRMRFEAQVLGGSRRAPNSAYLQVGPVDYFPTSYLYDPTGEIVMFIPGQIRQGSLASFMDRWHAQRAGQPAYAARVERLADYLRRQHGERGTQAYAAWKRMLDDALTAAPLDQLARVNDHFNRQIRVGDGARLWGRTNYWAAPGEVLGQGHGDGADIAIAKYFTLLALGMPADKLRLVYVTVRASARDASAGAPHLVLAYYVTPDAEPMLLDTRDTRLLPAGARKDLRPGYSFNSLGVWDETARAVAADGAGRPALWDDVLRRARAQGFEP